MLSLPFITAFAWATLAVADLTDTSLTKNADSLKLDFEFNPVKAAYWTGYPHHRRTPFALSSSGKSAYLAYLDNLETSVHVQQVDPATFAAVGTATTIDNVKEAGGLVAHDDGFALLTNVVTGTGTASTTSPGSTPIPVLYRYTNGQQTWNTTLGGPGVHEKDGSSMSPDLNGDLVYSDAAKLYGAYFVVTNYAGFGAGHFGDSIEYVNDAGELQTNNPAASSWGCSHNTGIAFEAADETPFASLCSEDHGSIWLNTATQGMNGIKVSNENTTNGAGGEAMNGMSGSYSQLARMIGNSNYIFSWVSRGSVNLVPDTWMGGNNVQSSNRTNNRNVAVALMSEKNTLVGPQAISQAGAPSGDDQVNWITKGTADCSNVHAAAFDGTTALLTWEEIADPFCEFTAMGCRGAFTGTKFQQVDGATGAKLGQPVSAMDATIAGDMVTMPDGRICWPYPNVAWDLSKKVGYQKAGAASPAPLGTVTSMSFACMAGGAGTGSNTTAPADTPASSSGVPAAPASSTEAAASASSVSAPTPADASPSAAAVNTGAAAPVPAPSAAAGNGHSAQPPTAAAGNGPSVQQPSTGSAGTGALTGSKPSSGGSCSARKARKARRHAARKARAAKRA